MKPKKRNAIVIDTPEFRSEAEDAEWWDRHQDLIADLLLNWNCESWTDLDSSDGECKQNMRKAGKLL